MSFGVFKGMWSGDVDSDFIIAAGDRSLVWNRRNQTGYLFADVNLDGVVNAIDRSLVWNARNLTTQLP